MIWRFAALGTALLFAAPTLATDAPPDPLVALNAQFRAWYAAEKSRRLEHPGPVVMVKGDVLVFLRNGGRKEIALLPPGYHRLKAISHLALAMEVKLAPLAGMPIPAVQLATLGDYRSMIDRAVIEFEKAEPAAAARTRSRTIASASQALLDVARESGSVSAAALRHYARAMAPLVLAEARDAAALELGALDSAILTWRKELDATEWRSFHAIVIGAHMAREQEVAMQYFLALTREKREGGRVIFLEGIWDEAKALDLLATHLLDSDIGRDFFDDPMRMHRDLLSDAAARWLKLHPPAR